MRRIGGISTRRERVSVLATAVALLAALVLPVTTTSAARAPRTQSLDIQVPVPPTPVWIAGSMHLAYELHVTSFRPVDVSLISVQALDGQTGKPLHELREAALAARIGRPGSPFDKPDKQRLSPGTRAVIYFWMAVPGQARAPERVSHRVEFDLMRPSGPERVSMEGAVVAVDHRPPLVLGPPLRGGPWVGLYDPAMLGGHRTSFYTMDGRARIPARYAIDFVKLGEDASRARGDASLIANFHGYGAEVLAVADATVVAAADDIEESPTLGAASGPMPLENASGNYVTLDVGGGRYAFYEHLKHGSVRVKVGQRVRRGDVIGLLGNSGSSSSGPHLHFHVSDTNSTLAAEGQAYVFARFTVLGGYDTIGGYKEGLWKPASAAAGGPRTRELPAANSVVSFD